MNPARAGLGLRSKRVGKGRVGKGRGAKAGRSEQETERRGKEGEKEQERQIPCPSFAPSLQPPGSASLCLSVSPSFYLFSLNHAQIALKAFDLFLTRRRWRAAKIVADERANRDG